MRRFFCSLLVFACLAIVCCGPSNLQHLHSKCAKAVIVPIGGTVSQKWGSALSVAFRDKKCKLVVAWIESGGGSVTEVRILAHRINALRAEYPKPFWVYSERMLASGAYWIACLADTIILAPSGRCGSIGVTYTRVDSSRADSANGVQWNIFRSGELKSLGHPHLPMSNIEAHLIAYRLELIYTSFVELIMQRRGDRLLWAYDSLRVMLPRGTTFKWFVDGLASGDVYNADAAKMSGLIDKVLWLDGLLIHLNGQGYKVSDVRGLPVKALKAFQPVGVCDSLIHRSVPLELKED